MTKKTHVLFSLLLLLCMPALSFAAAVMPPAPDFVTYSDSVAGVCTTINGQQNLTLCVGENDSATSADPNVTDPSVATLITEFIAQQTTSAPAESTDYDFATYTDPDAGVCTTIAGQQNTTVCVGTNDYALETDPDITDPTVASLVTEFVAEQAIVMPTEESTITEEDDYSTTNTGSLETIVDTTNTGVETIVDTTNTGLEVIDTTNTGVETIVDTTNTGVETTNTGISTCTLGDWDDMYCGGTYCTMHPEDTATCLTCATMTFETWDDMTCGPYCDMHPEDPVNCPTCATMTFETWDDMTCGPYCDMHSEDTINCPVTLIEPEAPAVTATSFIGDAAYCAVNPEDTVNCGPTTSTESAAAPAALIVISTCTLGDWDDMYCGGSYCTMHPEDTTCPCHFNNWDNMTCGGPYCELHSEDVMNCPTCSTTTFEEWDDMTCGPYCDMHPEDMTHCPI